MVQCDVLRVRVVEVRQAVNAKEPVPQVNRQPLLGSYPLPGRSLCFNLHTYIIIHIMWKSIVYLLYLKHFISLVFLGFGARVIDWFVQWDDAGQPVFDSLLVPDAVSFAPSDEV